MLIRLLHKFQTSSCFSSLQFCMCNKNRTQTVASWVMRVSRRNACPIFPGWRLCLVPPSQQKGLLFHILHKLFLFSRIRSHTVLGKQFMFLMKKRLPCFLFQKHAISKDKAKLTSTCISILFLLRGAYSCWEVFLTFIQSKGTQLKKMDSISH